MEEAYIAFFDPAFPKAFVSEPRVEAMLFNSPFPKPQSFYSLAPHFFHCLRGWGEVNVGAFVEPSQELPCSALEHAKAVVIEIFGKIGVEGCRVGYSVLFCVPESAKSNYKGGSQVYYVRLEIIETIFHSAVVRQSYAALRISKESKACKERNICNLSLERSFSGCKENILNVFFVHGFLHFVQSLCDPVYFRMVCVCEYCNFQLPLPLSVCIRETLIL